MKSEKKCYICFLHIKTTTMKRFLFYILFSLLTLNLYACSSDETPEPEPEEPQEEVNEELEYWKKQAKESTSAFIKHFWNKDKKFFNSYVGRPDTSEQDWCYWPQAHAMDVLIDAYVRSKSSSLETYFDDWYVGVKQKSGGSYYNDFVDDMEWICLTMIRLYEHTGDKKFITTAEDLWRVIKNNWNEEYSGGGIAWKQSQPQSKNSCANGPAGIIAARLYQLNGKKADDLAWAKKIYEWQTAKLVNTGNGKVYDHIVNHETGECMNWLFTYNQGTYMGMAHELYNITGEKAYLEMASKAANFCITELVNKDFRKNNNFDILQNEGDNGDGGLFKAVFVRYFVKLILEEDLPVPERRRYVEFFNNNAEVLNTKGTGTDYNYRGDWSKPGNEGHDLPTQTSGATMIEAKAYYELMLDKKNKQNKK